ncbi:MAG: lytic transglycosylase [Pseudomonadota bacterium]
MRGVLRIVGVVVLCGVLGSCATGRPPTDINSVCEIFDDRPSWRRAAVASEARWGAPVPVTMAIIWHESKFVSDARPPRTFFLGIPTGRRSSAFGYSQALDGTWDDYRRATRRFGADRDDFDDAIDFVGWYMRRTQRINGVSMTDARSQYLAYHEGHGGYRRGSWRSKGWLQNVASGVSRQAQRYAAQWRRCR